MNLKHLAEKIDVIQNMVWINKKWKSRVANGNTH